MDWAKEGPIEFLEIGSYRLERFAGSGPVISIKIIASNLEVKLGQRVYSNGRFWAPKGTLGIVVGIGVPFENALTTDIIVVHFEGDYCPVHMKFRDLDFAPLQKSA